LYILFSCGQVSSFQYYEESGLNIENVYLEYKCLPPLNYLNFKEANVANISGCLYLEFYRPDQYFGMSANLLVDPEDLFSSMHGAVSESVEKDDHGKPGLATAGSAESIDLDTPAVDKNTAAIYLSAIAIVISIISFVLNERRASSREARLRSNSQKDLFWFRTIISPHYMEPLFNMLADFDSVYMSLFSMADGELKDNKISDFFEKLDTERDVIRRKAFYLKALPQGESVKKDIEIVLDRLANSLSHHLYGSGLAMLPDDDDLDIFPVPFSDSLNRILKIFTDFQELH